jgi:solute carrier family 25 uncoupling protein 27
MDRSDKRRFVLIPAAATIAETCTHPIDFVKTQVQILKKSMVSCAKDTYKAGGIWGFYPSLGPAVGRHWIYTTLRVSMYESLVQDSFLAKIQAAFFAGATAQFVANPFDFLKIQIISDPTQKISIIVRRTFASYGIFGFFKGWQPNVARAVLVNSSDLVSYDVGKNFLIKTLGFEDSSFVHFLAGSLSGIMSTLVGTPADFVKSNFISQHKKYNDSLIQCITALVRERGFFVLWRGSFLSWMRLGPWQTVFWVSYEKLKILTKR